MGIDGRTKLGGLVPKNTKYMSKEDAGEDGVILTVAGFKNEMIGRDGDEEEKVVMSFREDMKPMVLNSTNAELLALATGATTVDEAIGKRIVVYNDPSIMFGGKRTGGLRIKKLAGAPRPSAPQHDERNPPPREPGDDDYPV